MAKQASNRIKVFDLAGKVGVIRDVVGVSSWAALAEKAGIDEKSLQRMAKDGGKNSLTRAEAEALALVADFELDHCSWIDPDIPEKHRLHSWQGRRDSAGGFQDYLFPRNGKAVRKHYLRVAASDAEAATPIYGGLWDDRQGAVAIEDFPVAAEMRVDPVYIGDGLSFGFSKITVSVTFDDVAQRQDRLHVTERYNQCATQHALDEGNRISKPRQARGGQWDITATDGFVIGYFEFPRDAPLLRVRPMLQPDSEPVRLQMLVSGHRFDGTLVDHRGVAPMGKHKEQVLAALLGDAFVEDDDYEGDGRVRLSMCHADIDYRFEQ